MAQAKATVKASPEKFGHAALIARTTSDGEMLTAERLGGQREELQISGLTAEVETVNLDFVIFPNFTPDMDW